MVARSPPRTSAVAHRCTIPWWATSSRTVQPGQVGTGAAVPAARAQVARCRAEVAIVARWSSTVGPVVVIPAVCPSGRRARQANCQERLLSPNQKPSMTLSTVSADSVPEADAAPSAT